MASKSARPSIRSGLLSCIAAVLATTLIAGCMSPGRGNASTTAFAATPAFAPASGTNRYLVVISDLHLGLGCDVQGVCAATEDFRWPQALHGLLDEVAKRGKDRVDLVIAGDFLELWQPPDTIHCNGPNDDLGCTVAQAAAIAKVVVDAHPKVFAALRDFAARGENRIHVIPGNHDSTLLLADVWSPVGAALGDKGARVELVASGVWKTADGRTVVEHGHQIGSDANKYDDWPQGVVRREGGIDYVVRPWGERFVQVLFNEQERQYPIIDNLSPETAGVRYRMADRGIWRSAADMAHFLFFNLWETSLAQKLQILGRPKDGQPIKWDLEAARSLGADLFVDGLAPGDPFRTAVLGDSQDSVALRNRLAELAKTIPETDVQSLCDLLAIRDAKRLCVPSTTLGALAEQLFTVRANVLMAHLKRRLKEDRRMTRFIYGHTHKYEIPWALQVTSTDVVTIANSGAFQRVIEDADYKTRAKNLGYDAVEGLRRMTPEDLAPCYTVVLAPPGDRLSVRRWYMPEDGAGRLVFPGSRVCR